MVTMMDICFIVRRCGCGAALFAVICLLCGQDECVAQIGSVELPSAFLRASISADHRSIAVLARDGRITLVEIPCLRKRDVLLPRSIRDGIRGIALSPSKELLAASHRSAGVIIWSIPERRELVRLKPEPGRSHGAAFAPDGKLLAVGNTVWDTGSWKVRSNISVRSPIVWHRFDAHRDALDLVHLDAFDGDTTFSSWNIATSPARELRRIALCNAMHVTLLDQGRIMAVPCSPISAGLRSEMRFQHIESGNVLGRMTLPAASISATLPIADGKLLCVASEAERYVRADGGKLEYAILLVDWRAQKVVGSISNARIGNVRCLASPEPDKVASLSYGGTLAIWDLKQLLSKARE